MIVQALKKFLRAKDPSFIFLMETKLHSDIANGMKQDLVYTQGISISSDGAVGATKGGRGEYASA